MCHVGKTIHKFTNPITSPYHSSLSATVLLYYTLLYYCTANFIYSRYENLNSSISSRGNLLHSGMASLQSFQPSADRFCSWLTRIEETADKLEKDCEKLRAQYGNEHVPEHELQPFKVGDENA